MDSSFNISSTIPGVSQGFSIVLSQASASVLMLWDIIITYDQEIELVWRARNSIVKYLFILIRYGGLSQVIVTVTLSLSNFKTKHNICKAFIWYNAFCSLLLVYGVDLILVYRAYAFYGRNRKVLIGLIFFWVLNGSATLVFAVLFSLRVSIIHSTALFVSGVTSECLVTSLPQLLHDLWISELIFQSFIFLFVSGRLIKLAATSWNKTMGLSNLYFVVIRDGIWAFLLLFGMIIFIFYRALKMRVKTSRVPGIFVTCAAQTTVVGLSLLQWALSLTAMMGSRLILNLRSLGASHTHGESTTDSKPTGIEVLFSNTLCDPDVVLPENVVELQRM